MNALVDSASRCSTKAGLNWIQHDGTFLCQLPFYTCSNYHGISPTASWQPVNLTKAKESPKLSKSCSNCIGFYQRNQLNHWYLMAFNLNRYIDLKAERFPLCPNSSQPQLSQITVATLTSNSPPDPPPPPPPLPLPPPPPVLPLQVDLKTVVPAVSRSRLNMAHVNWFF